MWAILIVCVALLLLTVYQVKTQGFFSTVLMSGMSMVAALVALNYYESITSLLAGFGLSGYGLSCISLLGLFSIVLLLLRVASDRLVSGNVHFPNWIDSIGAAFFGFISSMIVIGMILIGLQHLSIPAEFLKYNRYPNLEKLNQEKSLFPGPDRFVLAMASQASSFSFSGKNSFSQRHPDLLQELYINRLVPRNHEGSRNEAGSSALTLVDARLIDHSVRELSSGLEFDIPADERLLAVRLEIKSGAGKETPGASDVDGKIRYALGDFRLVGHDLELPQADGFSHYPVGLLKPAGKVVDKNLLDSGKILTTPLKQLDLLFTWPENLKTTPPQYVEFKRSAQAAMPTFEKLEEATLLNETLYDASNTATNAKLKNAGNSQGDYRFETLAVVTSRSQPLEDMGVPVNALVGRAQKNGHVDVENRYFHLHTEPVISSKADDNGPRMSLHVPKGMCLVYLKISSGSGNKTTPYVPPVLLDVFGQKHYSIGYSLKGTLKDKTVTEFAYTSYDQQKRAIHLGNRPSKRFPNEIKTLKKRGKLRSITQYYLVPQKDVPVGLLGAEMKAGPSDEGAFWVPSDDIDVLLVPEN